MLELIFINFQMHLLAEGLNISKSAPIFNNFFSEKLQVIINI